MDLGNACMLRLLSCGTWATQIYTLLHMWHCDNDMLINAIIIAAIVEFIATRIVTRDNRHQAIVMSVIATITMPLS